MKASRRYIIIYIILALLTLLLFGLNIISGSVKSPSMRIIMEIRMPRALAALLLGGSLSLSGYLLQVFFSNPIAGPYVLGISHGAKLMVAVSMIFALQAGLRPGSLLMIAAAFSGAALVTGFILIISSRVRKMSALIISGIMVGYICSAATDFLVAFADDADIINLHNWSMGSFSGMSWGNVYVIAVSALVGLALVVFLSKPVYAYQMGEAYAENLGVPVRLIRVFMILISGYLSAMVTAFAGPVSFVGIAVPHVVRKLFGTSGTLVLVPGIFLSGAAFSLFCDLIARTVFAPTELSISSVTALFGAPVVIVMLLERQRGGGSGWQ